MTTCEQMPLDRFVDDELSAAERLAVQAHVDGCAACRAEVEATRTVIAGAREHFGAAEPGRELWSEIAAEIEPPARVGSAWSRWAPLAAAAVALVVVSSATTAWLVRSSPDPIAVDGTEVAPPPSWQSELAAASTDLEAVFASRTDISEATRAVVRDNLQLIDHAIGEIEQALAEDPEDSGLQDALLASYQQRVRVLRQVVNVHTQAG